MSRRKTPLVALVILTLLAVTYYFWIKYYKPNYGVDDANIYFVYVRNFAEGAGFVWTPGNERVEGFTSLLWTLIGSFFYLISPQNFPFLLLTFNFLLIILTLLHVLRFVRRLNGQEDQVITGTDILILAMLFFPLGFIEWGVLGLMETGMWFAVIINTTLLLCRQYLDNRRINLWVFSFLP
ncbi:MAG: hypothetical protein EOO01_32110 [Chitinophagaceae bacterium]|nr:MAG: hypothetical protein EOO01_32110 [Chitinophagaceae bacterium]